MFKCLISAKSETLEQMLPHYHLSAKAVALLKIMLKISQHIVFLG